MRYVFRFGFALALGLALMAGCSDEDGEGGSGGTAGTGGMAGTGGLGGTGGVGGTGGAPDCESAEDCDDKNECTTDVCNAASGVCENIAVSEGSFCGGKDGNGFDRGSCHSGVCNWVSVNVDVIGAKEVVFDWTTDRCEDLHLPDQPARFVRAADGELVLFDANAPTYYVSRGADFDSLVPVCDPPALVSADLQTPESYENWEWIWVVYREGRSWHALIHNEFHDTVAPRCKIGDPSPANPCWYNSITHAVSTDDARTFAKPGAPAHAAAPAPRVWVPPAPDDPYQRWYAEGYLTPSNIVRGPDDYYYALFRAIPGWDLDLGGVCIMRTKSLHDPASWRAWDGTGFNLPLKSPYVTGIPSVVCEFLRGPNGFLVYHHESLTFNTYIDRYMAVASSGGIAGYGPGMYMILSTDLVHWSEPQLVVEESALEPAPAGNPSVIDHVDPTTNFERSGRAPYLYYTRHNPSYWLDRDLVRVPLTFTLEE